MVRANKQRMRNGPTESATLKHWWIYETADEERTNKICNIKTLVDLWYNGWMTGLEIDQQNPQHFYETTDDKLLQLIWRKVDLRNYLSYFLAEYWNLMQWMKSHDLESSYLDYQTIYTFMSLCLDKYCHCRLTFKNI